MLWEGYKNWFHEIFFIHAVFSVRLWMTEQKGNKLREFFQMTIVNEKHETEATVIHK